MLLRARFFDDWRLSRIDEEVERLSMNSDTNVAVDATSSSSTHAVQRSASAEGLLQPDDDNDEPPLPPPPSPLLQMTPPQTKKDNELDVQDLQRLDEETEALRFLQVKYDTLGKVKVEKRQTSTSQQPPAKTSGIDETIRVAGPQCQLNCDCSLMSTGDELSRKAVDSSSLPQSSTSHQGSVTDRRRPPPPPSTNRSVCSCPPSNETGSPAGDLQVSDNGRQHHHHHHQQQQQQQPPPLEQFIHQQRCSQTSASVVRHQSQHHESVDGSRQGSLTDCSCRGDQLRRGGNTSVSAAERQCCSMLSNAELFQIDLFYRSRKTFVYVCPCPAILYFCRAANSNGSSSSTWRFAAAGVPVIVVDKVRVAVGPLLHVVLAERGTGFELWRYGLTGVQQYAVDQTSTSSRDGGSSAAFHTVTLPSGNVAGLSFDDTVSAAEFYRQLVRLDELYATGGGSSRSRKGKKTATRSEVASGVHDIITRYFNAYRL